VLVFAASDAHAAPSGSIDITGPASIAPYEAINLAIAYSLTGTGVTNPRIVVNLPPGVYVSSAVGPTGVTTSCVGNWPSGDTCTFSLTFTSGGVAGQGSIAAFLYPGYQLDGATMTTTASLLANYDEGSGSQAMTPIVDTLSTSVVANADPRAETAEIVNAEWRVNPAPPIGKSAVGLSWEYRIRAISFGNANLSAGWTLTADLPNNTTFVGWRPDY
jgi:hypothetical protein